MLSVVGLRWGSAAPEAATEVEPTISSLVTVEQPPEGCDDQSFIWLFEGFGPLQCVSVVINFGSKCLRLCYCCSEALSCESSQNVLD